MVEAQSIEELLDSAERAQRGETQQAQQAIPDRSRSGSARLDHDTDYVSINDSRDRAQRDGMRGGDRYTPGGSKRDDVVMKDTSEDGNKSDRGSANGSVRSRRRSRSPTRERRERTYRARDDRSGGRGDHARRGAPDDDDRYYRPGNRDRAGDRRDDRRDTRDRRDERPERRDDRRREPRERRRTPPEPTDDERDRRTVFVQQLAARLRTQQLIDFFSQVGPVKEAQIVKDRVSNRSKGVGYVEFRSEESVEKALQLTGQKLLGIPIIAQLTEAEKNRQARNTEGVATLSNGIPFHRLYVGNIHFSITEEDLRTIFEPFGALEFCQLQKEEQGRSKGYGFVQ
jgi:RNA-binding protein 39